MRRVSHEPDQRCPFCSGHFAITENAGRPAVLHTLPPCIVWLTLEPLDFLAQAALVRANGACS
jgi:hypothetical protein